MKKLFILTISLFLVFAFFAEARIVKNTFSNIGLVGYWSFNEGFGTFVKDYSGNGNNASTSGFTGNYWVNGKVGKALSFDGSNDFVPVSDISAIDATTQLTASAWVYHNAITADNAIVAKGDGTLSSPFLWFRDDVGGLTSRTDMYAVFINGTTDCRLETATNSSPLNKWTHVAMTFSAANSTGLRAYINGVEDANSPQSTTGCDDIDASTFIVAIGRVSSGTPLRLFDGLIDEVRIYNRALSSTEISNMYKAGLTTH